MRKLLLLSACLMACAALALADDKKDEKKEDKTKSEATITPSELAISRKVESKLPYGGFSDGTRVSFILTYPKKHLLGVDKTSKMASMKDDKDNSLIDDKQQFSGGFSEFAQVAEDGSAMLVTASAFLKAPGKGATRILIKGDLVVLCGADEKTVESKKIEFKEKTKGKAGDFDVEVTREKDGFGADGPGFTVTTKSRGMRSLVVKDADGKSVEVLKRGWYGGDQRTYNYALAKPLKEGTIHVTYFSKEEKVKVPIDLSVGLDLGR
jgi:hypothetical protein